MKDSNYKLKVGITIGDVNGIGPELIIKAFQDTRLKELCIPIVYGSSRVLNIYRKILRINKFHYQIIQKADQGHFNKLNIIECLDNVDKVEIGQPSELGGLAAQSALKRAIEDAQHQVIDALVTLPVDKAVMPAGETKFVGHTEMLAHAFNVRENLMLMVSDEMRVGVVTNHVSIRDVPNKITKEKIIQKTTILHQTLVEDFNIQKPLIAILGLNPHGGDKGLIGKEEIEVITPAIEELKNQGMMVMGPYPPDGFFGSFTFKKFDGIIAMYHDQGLIPFKLLAGYGGVNYTAGMPFIRTSPDHGVAYDIAGKGIADAESLRRSLYLTMDIHRNRTMNIELKSNALKTSELQRE
ncbi:MAG: 4-hydroxythreonine-4-phosphate dehydrogenase PdxA [Bacteroidetes bacterium]|nr:4-hydroxythreonine-4-phosphate dehydrogenase PdxA [Bacteroidota bacterium]